MSRKQALNTISKPARDAYLKERGVTLLGAGLDESPQAYKPIEEVIAAQADLVEVLGKFSPRIVRMADEAGAGEILITKKAMDLIPKEADIQGKLIELSIGGLSTPAYSIVYRPHNEENEK
jgi:hypothetical protein